MIDLLAAAAAVERAAKMAADPQLVEFEDSCWRMPFYELQIEVQRAMADPRMAVDRERLEIAARVVRMRDPERLR